MGFFPSNIIIVVVGRIVAAQKSTKTQVRTHALKPECTAGTSEYSRMHRECNLNAKPRTPLRSSLASLFLTSFCMRVLFHFSLPLPAGPLGGGRRSCAVLSSFAEAGAEGDRCRRRPHSSLNRCSLGTALHHAGQIKAGQRAPFLTSGNVGVLFHFSLPLPAGPLGGGRRSCAVLSSFAEAGAEGDRCRRRPHSSLNLCSLGTALRHAGQIKAGHAPV